MSDPVDARITLAQARADAARARLSGTIGQLQQRTKPQVIANEVAENLKEKGRVALNEAIETARRQPVAVGIAAAAIGLFLLRKPIRRVFRRATSAAKKS